VKHTRVTMHGLRCIGALAGIGKHHQPNMSAKAIMPLKRLV